MKVFICRKYLHRRKDYIKHAEFLKVAKLRSKLEKYVTSPIPISTGPLPGNINACHL